ncbi:DoxX family protein [Rhodococcus sp. 06-235-1A]|uniref:DoxX family protein n=1 Tax=Rhodococcus sp. 06-235-1A TaxID=2022508 RepID=UPI000B9C292F|nr:DoxX family protein [Rhodococcus sp. 06-235-1A]OZD06553.1 DoxX family protein [Rhodococcus sp. 06-235-1A]
MNIFLWILAAVLAIAFLGAGGMKLIRTRAQLSAAGMGYVDDLSDTAVKAIGAVEVLGAFGLILPPVFGIAVILTPLAATGLSITMLAALAVHIRRREFTALPGPIVLGLLSAVLAAFRFGPHGF